MENVNSLIKKILELKKKRNAIILAHNYQLPEVQDIADYVGDSLGLSLKALQVTSAEIIIFCGVHFMAETAAILSTDKLVIMPDINARCPMADMVTVEHVKELKKNYPQAVIVSYVNTTAEVKAESDFCCTSANAVKVVNSLDTEQIIFLPDKFLGNYVSTQTGKKLILCEGYCPVHLNISPEDIRKQKTLHPKAEVIVHPECTPEVIALADKVLSTSGMCAYVKTTNASEIIVGTEIGIIYRLEKENPNKKFYPASNLAICQDMKLTNLEKILFSLEELKYEVNVPQHIKERARKAIDKMIQLGGGS